MFRNFLFFVLKGNKADYRERIDPPLPLPELVRDEFNAYKRSLFQEYLYGLIFKESSSASSYAISSVFPPEFSGLTTQLEHISALIPELISEVELASDKYALLELRWYNFPSDNPDKVSSSDMLNLFDALDLSSCPTRPDSGVFPFSTNTAPPSQAKIVGKSRLVKLLHSLLKSFSIFCGVCRNCVLKQKTPDQLLAEYSKRVLSYFSTV